MVWTFTKVGKCTQHEEDCTNFCVLLRKSGLSEKQDNSEQSCFDQKFHQDRSLLKIKITK